jgi:hypothetical protein
MRQGVPRVRSALVMIDVQQGVFACTPPLCRGDTLALTR